MTTRRTPRHGSTAAAKPPARRPVTPATSSAASDDAALIDAPANADVDPGALVVADDAAAQSIDSLPSLAGGAAAGDTTAEVGDSVSAAPPSCRHATTRTRQRGRGIERYCERCGSLIGTADDARYAGPL